MPSSYQININDGDINAETPDSKAYMHNHLSAGGNTFLGVGAHQSQYINSKMR